MNIKKLQNGVILIEGDEKLLAKIQGQSLAGIDVSDLRLDADTLASAFLQAEAAAKTEIYDNCSGQRVLVKTLDNIKRYAVLKQQYLAKFSK